MMTERLYQHVLVGKGLTCGMQGLSICAEQVWNGQAAMKEGIAQTQVHPPNPPVHLLAECTVRFIIDRNQYSMLI